MRPIITIVRTCLACRYLELDFGTPAWSDMTPGTDPSITCRKGQIRPPLLYELDQLLAQLPAIASGCPYFEVSAELSPESTADTGFVAP